jgi:hypothetical protein
MSTKALALVVAPIGLLVARVLAHPISNKPIDFVADVHHSASQTEAGAAVAIVSAVLLAWTLATIARTAPPSRLGVVAGVATVAGCTGLVLVATMQAIGARLSVQELDATASGKLFDAFYNTGALPVVAQIAIVVGVLGSIALGVALFRSSAVSRPAAVVTGIGSLLVFATAPGPAQPLLIAAAAVAAIGYFLVGTSRA